MKNEEQQELLETFGYNPSTGEIYWKVKSKNNKRKPGDVTGRKDTHGYLQVVLNRKLYLCHRLAWLIMRGHWPDSLIDHINGDPSDNRWENLRECDYSQNNLNSRTRKDNHCGTKGVTWHKSIGKWTSHISIDGKLKHMGCFDSKESAILAVVEARNKFHGEFANHG